MSVTNTSVAWEWRQQRIGLQRELLPLLRDCERRDRERPAHERRVAALEASLAVKQREHDEKQRDLAQLRTVLRDLQTARHARRAAWQRGEDYRADWANTEGIFARYRAAAADHREIIAQAIDTLMPRFTGEDYHRRPAPNYAFLSFDAKLITLGAFLGIDAAHDQFPLLVLNPEDWDADRYVFHHAGPADLAVWRRHLPTIRNHIEAGLEPKADFTVELWHDAMHVVLSRHPPFPKDLALDPAWLTPGELFLGIDQISRDPLINPLAELTHTLLCGASGTGKTNALHVLLRSLFMSLDHCSAIHLVDGKEGVAFHRYANRDPKIRVLWDVDDLAALLERLTALMAARNAAQREAGIDNATSDFEIVVIDELATFVTPPAAADKDAKQAHKRMIDQLIAIARRGRSVGIRLIITVQEPTEESLPVSVRSNLSTVLAFALPIVQHATAVFPDLAGLPADPRTLALGQAIYQSRPSGRQALVKLPLLTAPGARPAVLQAAPEPVVAAPPPCVSAAPVCQLHHATLLARHTKDDP